MQILGNIHSSTRGRIVKNVTVAAPCSRSKENSIGVPVKDNQPRSSESLSVRPLGNASPVKFSRNWKMLLAVVAMTIAAAVGFQFDLFFGSDKVSSVSIGKWTTLDDTIIKAAFDYQRPDLAERIAASAQAPTFSPWPERVADGDHALPVRGKVSSGSVKDGPVVSHRELTSMVYSIIKKHAPKHQNAHALAAAIVTESREQLYDPMFVAAVIKSESTFNTLAKSHKGAQGLMQIMPKTGAWLASKEDIPRGSLTDPGYNLRLGITYLKHLEELYDGNRVFVLIAYNWGPGHVESASEGKRRVPSEVVTYAVKIMNDYRKWVG